MSEERKKPKKYKKRKKSGDVIQHDNGRFGYDFQIRGQRYRASLPEATNQAQAKRAVIAIKNQIYEGKFGDGIKTPFAEFVKEVFEPVAKLKRSYHTFEKHNIKSLLVFFKDYALSEIRPLLVEKFKRDRLNTPVIGKKPRKPASVNRLLATLSGILSMACNNGLLIRNPCSKVKRLREDNARTRYLSIEEEETLTEGLKGPYIRLKPMVVIALNSGMRLSEIVNLSWHQVEWERNRINVINTKNSVDRTIPLTQIVKDLFIKLWRDSDKTNERVFPTQKASAISLSFRLLIRKLKLVDFHFHDLRHTFATRLAESGVDAFTIAALLGHKTLAMTQRYTHPSDDHKRKAVEVLSKYEQLCQKNVTIEFQGRMNRVI